MPKFYKRKAAKRAHVNLTKLTVTLITDEHEAGIAQTFYADTLHFPNKASKLEYGVYAQDSDSDSSALVAVVTGRGNKKEAEKIAVILENVLKGLAK